MKRKFRVPIPILLTTAKTVGNNLEAHLGVFESNFPQWTSARLKEFMDKVDRAGKKVGIKANEEQSLVTRHILSISAKVREDLRFVKVQIERNFREDKALQTHWLTLLGFHAYWKKSLTNQNALLNLLYTFDNHIDATLQSELIANGASEQHILAVKAYAKEMIEANVTQETLKRTAPVFTEEMIRECNAIYDFTIDICKMGQTIFANNIVHKAQFSFNKVAAQQMAKGKAKPATETQPDVQEPSSEAQAIP
jgi:hypothetical protein